MKVKAAQIAALLEQWAPLNTQEPYDNSGFQCGNPEEIIKGALVTLDVTPEILDEAVSLGANLIISHHPPVFKKLQNILETSSSGSLLIKALRSDITVYSLHTPADNAHDGVSFDMARQLGLLDLQFLKPGPKPGTGAGCIGNLPEDSKEAEFLSLVSAAFESAHLKFSGSADTIKTVAVCGGAGADLMPAAMDAGVDAFITADIRYHQFFPEKKQFLLIDCGHFESERPFVKSLAKRLNRSFPNLPVHVSTVYTNPVSYFTNRPEHIIV